MFKRFEVAIDNNGTELILISGSHGLSIYKAASFEKFKSFTDPNFHLIQEQIGINYIE